MEIPPLLVYCLPHLDDVKETVKSIIPEDEIVDWLFDQNYDPDDGDIESPDYGIYYYE